MNVDTPEGLKEAVKWQEGHVKLFADQGRWIVPRSGSIIVIDAKNKTATRVLGMAPETSIAKVFNAMGWTWVDRA